MTHLLRWAALGLFLTGCAAPKIMLSDSFIPQTNKVIRESLKPAGSIGSGDNATDLTNYYVQICDVSNGTESNCRTTLVLDNITNYAVRPRL